MATDTLSRSSSLSLDNYGVQSFPVINNIFQKHLEEAITMIPEPTSTTGCLLTDIGNRLIQASTIMTQLAEALVRGEHIQENSRRVMQEIEAENDFSELDVFDYMNKKHAVLRKMLRTLQIASNSIREEWADAPRPPIRAVPEVAVASQKVPPPSAITHSPPATLPQLPLPRPFSQLPVPFAAALPTPTIEQSGWPSPAVPASPQLRRHNSTASSADFNCFPTEETMADPISIPNVDMASLKIRGKGSYTCPYKLTCKKGGVMNGQLVVFERNCVFRAHLQKHERPFKCHLPGCPNKGGFARIDQLRRHQVVVKHNR